MTLTLPFLKRVYLNHSTVAIVNPTPATELTMYKAISGPDGDVDGVGDVFLIGEGVTMGGCGGGGLEY